MQRNKMTKDEAKKEISNMFKNIDDVIGSTSSKDFKELVDKIYDNFENRICKNCKYFDEEYNIGFCVSDWWKEKNFVDGDLLAVDKNFGCNKFEKKTTVKEKLSEC